MNLATAESDVYSCWAFAHARSVSKFGAFLLTMAVLGVFSLPSQATPVTITNPSFENPVVSTPGSFTGIATGWTSTGGSPVTDYPQSNQFVSVPNGNQVEILNDFNGQGTLSQTLSATVTANTTYTLTFYVGNDLLLQFNGYSASLVANGSTLALDTNGVSPTAGHFLQDTLVYNSGPSPAQLGQPLEITFSDVGDQSVAFDEVQLDASPTPEPGTWTLVAGGIGLFAARRWRPKASQI